MYAMFDLFIYFLKKESTMKKKKKEGNGLNSEVGIL